MIMPIILYEAIAFQGATPPISLQVPLLAHLGLILMAASILSLGMFISSLTDSTIFFSNYHFYFSYYPFYFGRFSQ